MIKRMASYSETLPPPREASLIMQSHAPSFLIGKCTEIIVQSIPEKNRVVEFHGPRTKFVTYDKRFKSERVLELSES